MNDIQLKTIEQLNYFLAGTQAVTFTPHSKKECYHWIAQVLSRFDYHKLRKRDKNQVIQYLIRLTGYSRQQITRLINSHRKTGRIEPKAHQRSRFTTIYTRADILLLAQTDELHQTLSGPATRKLCERAFHVFKQAEYERLAQISVSHLYNLRKSYTYQQKRYLFTKTQRTAVSIGERRKPQPNGMPGYLRIDTVHQGDQDKRKGVYHINVIDEVTQWEIVVTVEKISKNFLIPALEILLDDFPFALKGFHSDNGSEYVNKQVAKLLNKLLIEFTKSRSRHSNDNALAESKNVLIRKHFGYEHIPQRFAGLINTFNQKYLNPYLNFHRPCFFAVTKRDAKGKEVKTYPYKNVMTPYDKLKSLPKAETFLKAGITFTELDKIALAMTDNETAKQMNQAKQKLFKIIFEQKKPNTLKDI